MGTLNKLFGSKTQTQFILKKRFFGLKMIKGKLMSTNVNALKALIQLAEVSKKWKKTVQRRFY